MGKLDQLKPAGVFRFFEEICQIPHGSGNVDQISNYLAEFARDRELEYYQDEVKNVIIIKEATAGYEMEEPVLLQGHMDMVAVKRADCAKDMKTEGLDLEVDGDWLYAVGTSLGGDDGIAVAYALAILDAKDIPHPRLEVIITVDEETGMEGANGIDLSMCKGHRMINLDNEEEGVLLTSCAGGGRIRGSLPVIREKRTGVAVKTSFAGLLGGHSGAEIDKGRANANVLLGRLMADLAQEGEFRFVNLQGGTADNAIAPASSAVIWMEEKNLPVFEKAVRKLEAVLQKEYAVNDPGIRIETEVPQNDAWEVFDADSTRRVMTLLYLMPNGIQSMSPVIPGLVQTSINLGILETAQDCVELHYSVRSSVSSEKDAMIQKACLMLEMMGGSSETSGMYPAWEFRADSPLRERMVTVYEDMFGTSPKVEAIHAGLECGILSGKIADLDCVSIGPDMKDIHTPDERLSISSTERMWNYLLAILAKKEQ